MGYELEICWNFLLMFEYEYEVMIIVFSYGYMINYFIYGIKESVFYVFKIKII